MTNSLHKLVATWMVSTFQSKLAKEEVSSRDFVGGTNLSDHRASTRL